MLIICLRKQQETFRLDRHILIDKIKIMTFGGKYHATAKKIIEV